MALSKAFLQQRWARAEAAARRLGADRSGASAVEFALIATPFFLLLFGILEVALVFFASAIIENSVSEASREIRTGRLQRAGETEVEFRASICEQITTIADCGRLKVDVRTFENFDATRFDFPIREGDLDDGNFMFDPGGAGDVVVVRVFYDWPLLGPGIINGLSNMSGNRRLIVSTTAFRNEPFEES